MADLAARLEPYLLLARSTKGQAAAKVVMDATAAPGVYVFSELMQLPNIQELGNDTNLSNHLALLQLFAYGTLATYNTNPAAYPPVTPAHLLKLKHLTLVSLALRSRSLPYDQLQTELQLPTIRELEDLIIDAIYAGLLGGKMHHHEKVLHVDWAAGRDLTMQDLEETRKGLENWRGTARNLLDALDKRIQQVKYEGHVEAQHHAQYIADRDELYRTIANDSKSSQGDRNNHGSSSSNNHNHASGSGSGSGGAAPGNGNGNRSGQSSRAGMSNGANGASGSGGADGLGPGGKIGVPGWKSSRNSNNRGGSIENGGNGGNGSATGSAGIGAGVIGEEAAGARGAQEEGQNAIGSAGPSADGAGGAASAGTSGSAGGSGTVGGGRTLTRSSGGSSGVDERSSKRMRD